MSDNLAMLVAMEAKMAIKPEDSLEDQCRAAMKAAKGHWMVLDEDTQFKGAVAAIYELSDEETRGRIVVELEALKALSALLSGVPVDFENVTIPDNPIGLRDLWQEVTR